MKRIIILAVLGVVVIAGVFAVLTAAFSPREHTATSVRRGPIEQTVYATGFVEAMDRRVLRAQRAGVVGQVFERGGKRLREGDEVRKGEPILRLRDTSLAARKKAAQADISRISAQLKEGGPFLTGFGLRIAEAERLAADERERADNYKKQQGTGSIPLDQINLQETRATMAEQRRDALKEELSQTKVDLNAARLVAEAALAQVESQEADDLVVAPLEGVILRLPLEQGEFAASGAELAVVGDVRNLIIEAEVNEDDIGAVRLEQPVNVRLAGFDEQRVKGRVFEILPDADRATKGYLVKVAFQESRFIALPGSELRGNTSVSDGVIPMSGMTAELGIIVKQDTGLVFPRTALTPDNTVFVLKDGVATETRVTLGLSNFELCEAKSGLAEGDQVITSDLRSLKDGARVKLKGKP